MPAIKTRECQWFLAGHSSPDQQTFVINKGSFARTLAETPPGRVLGTHGAPAGGCASLTPFRVPKFGRFLGVREKARVDGDFPQDRARIAGKRETAKRRSNCPCGEPCRATAPVPKIGGPIGFLNRPTYPCRPARRQLQRHRARYRWLSCAGVHFADFLGATPAFA